MSWNNLTPVDVIQSQIDRAVAAQLKDEAFRLSQEAAKEAIETGRKFRDALEVAVKELRNVSTLYPSQITVSVDEALAEIEKILGEK